MRSTRAGRRERWSGRLSRILLRGPALIAIGALLTACAGRPGLPDGTPPAPDRLRVQVLERGVAVVREIPLEDYVAAAVLSEFSPASGDERMVERMLEVQAIIARTYAIAHRGRHARDGYDLCSTTHCQLYAPGRLQTSRWAAAARAATARTSHTTLWFDNGPADAVYHADCGGRTSAAIDVWGASSPPYLRSVTDDGPAAAAHSAWRYDVDRDAVRRALNADSRTAVGAHLAAMTVAARDPSGRVQRLSLKGDTDRLVRGTDFREVLTNAFGPRAVRSTLFDVEAAGDTFTFTGSGFGHGVGLCQAGAFARVAAGLDPRTVLEFYFPGTNLLKLR